jgi:signal transduction histidine kinase
MLLRTHHHGAGRHVLGLRLYRGVAIIALLCGGIIPSAAQWANFDRDSLERLMDPTVFDTVQLGRYQKMAGTWMLSSKMQPYMEQVDTLTRVLMEHPDEKVRRHATASRSSYYYYQAYRHKFQRDFHTALRLFQQSLEMHPNRDQPRERAGYSNALGILYRAAGAPDLAIGELQAAIAYQIEAGDTSARQLTKHWIPLAGAHADQGDHATAMALLDRCDTAASLHRGRIFTERAHIADLLGDEAQAIAWLEKGDRPDSLWGDPWDRINVLSPLALHRLRYGDAAGALATAKECVRIAIAVGDEAAECGCLTLQGQARMAMGDLRGAESDLHTALGMAEAQNYVGISRETGDHGSLVNITGVLKELYQLQGRTADALRMTNTWVHMRDSVERMQDRESILRHQLHLDMLKDSLQRAEADLLREMEHGHALKEERTRRYAIAFVSLIVVLALTASVLFIHNKRRQEKRLAAMEHARLVQEKVIAELRIREQVGRDMHDDMGAGLSAMRLKSELAQQMLKDPEARARLAELAELSDELMGNMHHIIWALTSDRGSVADTVAHCVNHARSYLGEHEIAVQVDQPARWPAVELDPQHRRNLFLVLKEALHNVVKHAHAGRVHITFAWDDGLTMTIVDDGHGTKGQAPTHGGNGLRNMRRRMEELGGTFDMEHGRGTAITCHLPFTH